MSMTGFGSAELAADNYVVNCEIKTVNHRFKDFRFRMSSQFNAIELELRKILSDKFKRGSIDVVIQYKRSEKHDNQFNLDFEKINTFINSLSNELNLSKDHLTIEATTFLRPEFYTDRDQTEQEKLQKLALKVAANAADEANKLREKEGSKLAGVLLGHVKEYEDNLKQVELRKSKYNQEIQDKLIKRFKDNTLELDPNNDDRFQKELIYYLEKQDVDEEINRAKLHLAKLKELFAGKDEENGRKIEFLLQELNRESNTIGSKSAHESISECVVGMKVNLEKMREQALNIE